ncbi:hypothetical protein ACIRPK_36080 [Kitasatospora sp. NPDC101801]|uniref:hypothetical protein n=1 Tax=Kitasatospora sp. NPDC101801 TaxID=3364103 RepID=UPI0037FD6F2B
MCRGRGCGGRDESVLDGQRRLGGSGRSHAVAEDAPFAEVTLARPAGSRRASGAVS